MNNRLEFDSEFCHVRYIESDNVVFLTWKKFARIDDYREPALFALDLLKQFPQSNFIVDARNGFEDDEEDVKWGFSELLPNMAKTDCRYVVFIMQKASDIEDEMDMWTKEFSKYFVVNKVESYEQAIDKINSRLLVNVSYTIKPGKRDEFLKDKGMILETERLILREMTQTDLPSLGMILQDDDVMYAYEGAFSINEVQRWLDKQIERYREYGFGLWAVVLKETGIMIGQCGLTMQAYNGSMVLEIGYLFQKEHWHHGYASEAARACKKYAFEKLNAKEVYSIIRDTNIPSQNVARRNGMTCIDKFVKHYRGVDMPHLLYSVKQ